MNEQMKLLYLNGSAARVMKEICENSGDMGASARLQELEEENSRIISFAGKGEFTVSPEDAEILLEINRELRRFYDQSASSFVENFDTFFAPAAGWDWVYQSWEQ